MGREHAWNLFARTVAQLGLAATILFGFTGGATAAPADRAGDPVVLRGSELTGLIGLEPARIVGFKWDGGWQQVPVQVDERHTISARQLYPDEPKVGYVDPGAPYAPTFDIEVYADEKTRSGPDANADFDADDELVFMGGDAGSDVPAGTKPPAGVDGGSGIKVAVGDPVGGGSAALYLFRATSDLDPGAGKDYVEYDFKLTNLAEGQTLKEHYGYIHSTNPEDSSVTTDSYELHSVDRWMEDELRVKAGGASGVDILDRETAQAFLNQCGRTQYTFSGRWTEDTWAGNDGHTDDEGTYVTVIDGPVRAIRSYMGANSGPYTQREHVYYGDQELNRIFLRVHVMQDLYSWTDYSTAAVGMTYRDANNQSGVPVDGNPDDLVPTASEEVTNGSFSWQQLSGPQGSVSTVLGASTDIPDPSFGNYYLDDSTPVGAKEVQCGGDGQSIGASGFGILGAGGIPVTPNTDPRDSGGFSNLTIDRTRFFGAPTDGAAEAEAYRDRVAKPLEPIVSSHPVTGPAPGAKLRLSFPGKKSKARRGKVLKVRVKVENRGEGVGKSVKVCVRSGALRARGACRTIKAVPVAGSRMVIVPVRVKRGAKGKKLRLKVTAISGNGKAKASKVIAVGLRR